MIFGKQTQNILGMNARNLSYIYKYNNRTNKRFADDKIFTKKFLESRGIGVAKLYHTVSSHTQLTPAFFDALPTSFVVKPNRGYAGGGIMVINSKKGRNWHTISGKKITEDQLFGLCIEILEGKYSISGTTDQVIFEEKLDPHKSFSTLTNSGLPDVRVIVFNMVPVMAMLRVPTPASDGKANMELGAIGMGIDLGTGKTTGGALKTQYITKIPNGESAIGFEVPFWDEILLACSKIQRTTKIGFLGVDLVITNSGIKVLEVNARPGLKIQVANRIPLKGRLEKVADLKVIVPEDGVEIAKTLFSASTITDDYFERRLILGTRENVLLNGEHPQSLEAKIDLLAENNIIDAKFLNESEKILDITLEPQKRLKLPVKVGQVDDADLILAGKYLKDFYIDPGKLYIHKNLAEISSAKIDTKKLLSIDKRICDLDREIKLLSYLNPQNLETQKQLFFEHKTYQPQFQYRDLKINTSDLRNELRKIPIVNHELFPLYKKKIQELNHRLDLLDSIDSVRLGDFSKKVFGGVSRTLYQEALKFVKHNEEKHKIDPSEEFDLKKSIEILEEFLKKHNLGHWKLKILEDAVVDIQVTKKDTILLKKGAKFQENRLKALLVHEIGTHVFRYENGKRQPLELLARGTAGYLKTEEGLAVWNQNQLKLALGEKYLTPAYLIIAIYMAGKMGFVDLYHYLLSTFKITEELAWKLCVKTKRGLKNTEIRTTFTKDAIYFAGNKEVERFVKNGGTIEELYTGKIGIADLSIIKKIPDLKSAKFLI